MMRKMHEGSNRAMFAGGSVNGQIRRWKQALPRLVITSAAVLSLTVLAGCNNSPSGRADNAALQASNKAARIAASAGDFRPRKNFPGKLSEPLKSTSALKAYIRAHVGSARSHPAPFLMPRSKSRDLRHAAAIISSALASPDLHYEFKGLLEAQAGFIALDDSQRSLVNLDGSLAGIRDAVDGVNDLALTISGQNATLQALGTGADMLRQFGTALRTAKTEQIAARANVARALAKATKLSAGIAALETRRSALDEKGTLLEDQSRQTSGPASLHTFGQAVALLNKGAVRGEKIEMLKGRLDFAQADLAAAKLKLAAATAKVGELAAALRTAQILSRKQAARMAAIKAGISTLIAGKHRHLFTLNRRIAALMREWKIMERSAAAAIAAAKLADQHLQAAAAEESKSRSEASQMQRAGMSSYNPLVVAKSNTTAECLLDIYRGLARLDQAQVYELRLTAIAGRMQAQADAGKAYATIAMTSPLPALNGATQTTLKAAATKALNEALSALGQARALYPSGTSPVKWLTPAVETMVYLQLSQVAPDDAQRIQMLAKAAQAAAEAHRHNPFLILPKIAPAQ